VRSKLRSSLPPALVKSTSKRKDVSDAPVKAGYLADISKVSTYSYSCSSSSSSGSQTCFESVLVRFSGSITFAIASSFNGTPIIVRLSSKLVIRHIILVLFIFLSAPLKIYIVRIFSTSILII